MSSRVMACGRPNSYSPRTLCPSTLLPPIPTTMASTTACASNSARRTAACTHAVNACWSINLLRLQPVDATSPWPRYLNRPSSSSRMIQRVKALPRSRPTASGVLFCTAGILQTGDAIVQAQVKSRSLRHLAMDVRKVVKKILEARREIGIAHQKRDGAALCCPGNLQVVQVGNVNFGDSVGAPAQILHQLQHPLDSFSARARRFGGRNTREHREA